MDKWHSIVNCSCNVRDLIIDGIVNHEGPSFLTEFVRKRERELLIEPEVDLEELLNESHS